MLPGHITGIMPKRIVDPLEMVNVHREHCIGLPTLGQHIEQAIHGSSIRELCEGIVLGFVAESPKPLLQQLNPSEHRRPIAAVRG
ncbi:Uncharacterised protein [Pseudomonas aeruginosa]|nr:hypothetical protein Q072_02504 [Pseudomonas aeruginosa BL18]SUD07627.1 Uncharacterised protein [Pseudomonas aeruginosa]